jgi:hypothetical protein
MFLSNEPYSENLYVWYCDFLLIGIGSPWQSELGETNLHKKNWVRISS